MPLITRAEYKTWAGIGDTSLDAAIDVLIPIAQGLIESACGRPSEGFASASRTEDVSGTGTDILKLKCWPITTVTTVQYRDSAGGLTTLGSNDYRIDETGRFLVRPDAAVRRSGYSDDGYRTDDVAPGWEVTPKWIEGINNYRVTYTGGYSTVPAQLKFVCYRMVDQLFTDRRQPTDLQSETDGGYSYTKAKASGDVAGVEIGSFTYLLSDWMPKVH